MSLQKNITKGKKKLKVGMLSTPWHNVQFCKNKQPAIVESSKFEKQKQGFAYEKPKKLIQTIHKKKLEVNQNHGSHK